jgi:hypothetical protein
LAAAVLLEKCSSQHLVAAARRPVSSLAYADLNLFAQPRSVGNG